MTEIKPGEHFRDAAPTLFGRSPDWVVEHIFVASDGNEYARLRSVIHHNDRKTLSTAILRDKRRFIRMPSAAS